jgi:hypothetical protein
MKPALVGVIAFAALAGVGVWRFVAWANQSTLDVFNGTEADVDVDVNGRTLHVAAGGYRDVGKVANGTSLVTRRGEAPVETVSLDADQTVHFVYNVAGAGELFIANYSGLYECKGAEGKPLAAEPITIEASLKGQALYAYSGRFLLGKDEPLPETGLDCSLGVVRAEVIPHALLGRDTPVDYLRQQLKQQDRFRVKL